MAQILIVDDELNILAALKRELKSCNREFEIETYASPIEALARARDKSFDIVIADYKMPEMNGVDFLDAFQKLQPDAARIMLSGQIDIEGLAASINATHIYRFIAKPWSPHELLGAITQALDYRKALLENRMLAEKYKSKHNKWPAFYLGREYQILLVGNDWETLQSMAEDVRCPVNFKLLYAELHQSADQLADLKNHHFSFAVDMTSSPPEALEWAQRTNYDLVIADYHLAGTDGIRFLKSFINIQPDAACVLVSNHTDIGTLSNAINDIGISNFVAKPWAPLQLSATITHAIAYRNYLLENKQLATELRYDIDGLTV